jgi:hypothetical protein
MSHSTRLSPTFPATRTISTSWFIRLKNFSKSRSTTRRLPEVHNPPVLQPGRVNLLCPQRSSTSPSCHLPVTVAAAAGCQTSPYTTHPPSGVCPPHIQPCLPCSDRFEESRLLLLTWLPPVRFLFIRPGLCPQLPSVFPSRQTPVQSC